ncbi:MAG: hypothetical protein ACLRZ9_02630 [Eubacterium sp.]
MAAIVTKAVSEDVIIAGICDASVYLGAMGLLNKIEHTSNTL